MNLRDEVLRTLKRSNQAKLSSVCHVSTEQLLTFRATRAGEPLTVRIKDLGPDYHLPEYRYECRVEAGGMIVATGNAAGTPRDAILNTHWQRLRGLGTSAREGGDASGDDAVEVNAG